MRNICFTIPQESISVLDSLVAERDITRSQIIREALEEYLKKPINRPTPSKSRGWKRENDVSR